MSRVIPVPEQGFTGTGISQAGPRAMGVDAEGKISVVTQMNSILGALYTKHDNGTADRPEYLPVNGEWIRVNADGSKDLCIWDGQNDHVVCTIFADGKFKIIPIAEPPTPENPNGIPGILTVDGDSIELNENGQAMLPTDTQAEIAKISGLESDVAGKLDISDYTAHNTWKQDERWDSGQKYFDGRTIWYKYVYFGTMPSATSKSVSYNEPNLDISTAFVLNAHFYRTGNGDVFTIPLAQNGTSTRIFLYAPNHAGSPGMIAIDSSLSWDSTSNTWVLMQFCDLP